MNAAATRALGPPRRASITRGLEKAAAYPERCSSNFDLSMLPETSAAHKEEIDALGGVGGSPSCRCHQRGNHEGSQSAHYVDTVLHCEQPGRLSPQRRRGPQSLSCPSPPLASGATSGPGRPKWLIVGLQAWPCQTRSSQVPMRNWRLSPTYQSVLFAMRSSAVFHRRCSACTKVMASAGDIARV